MIISKEDKETWRDLIFRGLQPQGHCKCITNIEIQEPVKMKTPQEKAAELLPFVQALSNGEEVMQGDFPANGNFIYGLDFSIKPKMMIVNGFEVPEPMRLLPAIGSLYFTPYIKNCVQPDEIEYEGDKLDLMWISLGICHSTKDAAIAHAKAMLNIDPNGGE